MSEFKFIENERYNQINKLIYQTTNLIIEKGQVWEIKKSIEKKNINNLYAQNSRDSQDNWDKNSSNRINIKRHFQYRYREAIENEGLSGVREVVAEDIGKITKHYDNLKAFKSYHIMIMSIFVPKFNKRQNQSFLQQCKDNGFRRNGLFLIKLIPAYIVSYIFIVSLFLLISFVINKGTLAEIPVESYASVSLVAAVTLLSIFRSAYSTWFDYQLNKRREKDPLLSEFQFSILHSASKSKEESEGSASLPTPTNS